MKVLPLQVRPLKLIGYGLLAVGVVLADQFSKGLAYSTLSGRPPIEVLPFLQWALVFNRGAAFGFLGDAGGWQHYVFTTVAVTVSLVLVGWLWRAHKDNALLSVGLALLLGGALGNLLDRLSHQYVVDFIVVHYGNWYFPAFNLADSAITIGAAALMFDAVFRHAEK